MRSILLRVLVPLAALAALALLSACSNTIPEPTGSYPVGSTVLAFSDPSRIDPLAPKDGPRRFLARVWYPAQTIEGHALVKVVSSNQAEALSKFMNYPRFLTSEGSTAHSYIDAPPLTGKAWPVIFFEHGGFSMETQNFVFLENLASHGYVVFALNHPHESLVSEFPDGSVVWAAANPSVKEGEKSDSNTANQTFQAGGDSLAVAIKENNAATTDAERWRALANLSKISPYLDSKPALELRIGDLEYLRGALAGLNRDTLLRDTMDTGKVGLIGHSMGGYTVGEALLRHPESFALAVNMDGPQIVWDSAKNLRFARPVLFMYSTDLNFGGRLMNPDGLNRVWATSSSAPAWEAVIQGMGHFNYSDLGYLSSMRYSGLVGPIEGLRGGFLYTSLVQDFVDKYLKKAAANSLDALPADWKEVTVRSWHLDVPVGP